MALAAARVGAEVIGLVGSVLGIVQFGQGNMPAHDDLGIDSSLRIHLGLDRGPLVNAQGKVADIKVYDENRVLCGAGSGNGFIGDGASRDIKITQGYGTGKQPTYIQINGADDAVCIAYITQTWPDGQQQGWLGDMGQVCGADWQYSNVYINNYSPKCTWIDQNHDNIAAGALQMHMIDFNKNSTEDYSKDPAHYCSWPTMYFSPQTQRQGMPDNQIWGSEGDKGSLPSLPAPAAATTSKQRRTLRKRSPALANTIVGSQNPQHSALELCGSATSYGTDFVSFHEGIFCDMETKTAWPLCDDGKGVDDNCYRWDSHTLIDAGGHTTKDYDDVQQWK